MRSFSRRERLLVICYRLLRGGFNHGDHPSTTLRTGSEHREKQGGYMKRQSIKNYVTPDGV